ncbi:hypothetical protein HDU84_005803 [Entophlyctis sp. JEL0112]|nr:hypothetical protein HDU84_005803 [Entophlyctis sp. JEL0112]
MPLRLAPAAASVAAVAFIAIILAATASAQSAASDSTAATVAAANATLLAAHPAVSPGIFSTLSKLYAAYLFVIRSSLVISGIIVFYPDLLGL